MRIAQRIEAINERICSDALYDSIKDSCDAEAKRDKLLAKTMKDDRTAKEALAPICNEEQAAALDRIECLEREHGKYGMRFAFTRGVFAGFQQFFTKARAQAVFENQVVERVMRSSGQKYQCDRRERKEEINRLYNLLRETLPESCDDQVTDMEFAADDRFYAVLRHSFYTGYRYALSVIDEVTVIGQSTMVGKVLETENELGFTPTFEERERVTEILEWRVKNSEK